MHSVDTLFNKWVGIKIRLLKSISVNHSKSYSDSVTDLYNNLTFITHDDDVNTNVHIMYMTDVFLNNIYNLDDNEQVEMAKSICLNGYFTFNKVKRRVPETLCKKLRQNINVTQNELDMNGFLAEIISLSENISMRSYSDIDFSDAEVVEYGNEKYKLKPFNKQKFRKLVKQIIPTSSKTIRDIFPVPFDSPITTKELYDTIINTKKSGVIGPDNIPITNYINLNNDDLSCLVQLFNTFLEYHYIPSEFKVSTLRFIRKSNTSGRDLDDYRFISVFNTDYKLFTRILNNRLSHYMKTMISTYQKGWCHKNMKQDMFESIGLLDFAIQWVPDDGDIIYMDFKSAYENVCHELLFEIARMTKIDNFEEILRSLYNGGELIYKDHKRIQHNRGLRLGDPISPTLFALIMNVFMNFMRTRHYLSGLELKLTRYSSAHINIISYVDDFLMIAKSQKDLLAYKKNVDEFCNVTNFKVNDKKTITFKDSIKKHGYFDYLHNRFTIDGIEDYSATTMLNKLIKVTSKISIDTDRQLYHYGTNTTHYIRKYLRKVLFISGMSPEFQESKSILSTIKDNSHLGKHNVSCKQDPNLVKYQFIGRIGSDNTNNSYISIIRAIINHPDKQYVENSGSIMKILDNMYRRDSRGLLLNF